MLISAWVGKQFLNAVLVSCFFYDRFNLVEIAFLNYSSGKSVSYSCFRFR